MRNTVINYEHLLSTKSILQRLLYKNIISNIVSLTLSLQSKMKYSKSAVSLHWNFMNLEWPFWQVSDTKWPIISGTMLIIRLRIWSKECFICFQTFPPIKPGSVRKRALRNLVKTINYLKLPCWTLNKAMLTSLRFFYS